MKDGGDAEGFDVRAQAVEGDECEEGSNSLIKPCREDERGLVHGSLHSTWCYWICPCHRWIARKRKTRSYFGTPAICLSHPYGELPLAGT
jgi:hypothetical protein